MPRARESRPMGACGTYSPGRSRGSLRARRQRDGRRGDHATTHHWALTARAAAFLPQHAQHAQHADESIYSRRGVRHCAPAVATGPRTAGGICRLPYANPSCGGSGEIISPGRGLGQAAPALPPSTPRHPTGLFHGERCRCSAHEVLGLVAEAVEQNTPVDTTLPPPGEHA